LHDSVRNFVIVFAVKTTRESTLGSDPPVEQLYEDIPTRIGECIVVIDPTLLS